MLRVKVCFEVLFGLVCGSFWFGGGFFCGLFVSCLVGLGFLHISSSLVKSLRECHALFNVSAPKNPTDHS